MAKKIAIVGRPGVGKTTLAKKLAKELGLKHIETDDLIGKVEFKDVPQAIAGFLGDEGYIVEGVQVARMLRKKARGELEFNPDKVIVVDANTRVDSKHKGLAALNKSAIQEWLDSGHQVEVETVENDLRGP